MNARLNTDKARVLEDVSVYGLLSVEQRAQVVRLHGDE